jgi:hypothetical protein
VAHRELARQVLSEGGGDPDNGADLKYIADRIAHLAGVD